jgi:hypothetical protein
MMLVKSQVRQRLEYEGVSLHPGRDSFEIRNTQALLIERQIDSGIYVSAPNSNRYTLRLP